MMDVAEACGVSQASVSYAFNKPERLSPEQRANILRIAKEMGYGGPDPSARSLRTGRTGAWGLLINEQLTFALDDPTTMHLLRGVGMVCDATDTALSLLPVPVGGNVKDKIRLVQNSLVDGFLAYFMPSNSRVLDAALARGVPLVTIDLPRIDGVSFIGIDDAAGAEAAATHILELGHRKIAILIDRLMPDQTRGFAAEERVRNSVDPIGRDRLKGYRKVFAAAGIDPLSVPVFEAGGYNSAIARAAASDLMDLVDVTAVIATSDTLAIAVKLEMAARGYSAPQDYSVIGFDGIQAASEHGLTTIKTPLVEKGRRAAEMLRNAIAGETFEHILLETKLKRDRSTGPAKT